MDTHAAAGSPGAREALTSKVPLQALLGHINFSEGKPDPRFQKQLSDALAVLQEHGPEPWNVLHDILRAELAVLHQGQGSAFRNIDQADAVLKLVFSGVLPAYRRHHADLLFHQGGADLFGPFFLARVFEAVLAQRGPWPEDQRIVTGALRQLNDYVGHRPIAVLESRPRGEPYDHERLRPIPLYIKGAGVASGRYQPLLEKTLEILQGTDTGILQDAYFDPNLVDELSLDPRGYDFGHPADKRPNYIFGEWDPHHVDNQGRYRRFVVRQIILDGLVHRLEKRGSLDAGEVLWEAGAVLAGTILMAAGVSGAGPETHDSSTTLSNLLPRIAAYREAFYDHLLKSVGGTHAERLRREAAGTRQPFGGTRQHLNQFLAHRRARQLQQRHLALLFAEIGYPEASRRQAGAIPVASVRLLTEMHIRLTTGRLHVERGELDQAAQLLPQVEDLLHRGIDCGAVVDPWNILGFQGQYPRFTALEDSVRDHRIDELIDVVAQLFDLYALVLSEGAADGTLPPGLAGNMKRLADWWDRFATVEVSDVERVHGGEIAASAEHVTLALSRWRQRGTATADLAFWREYLDSFNSPKAFALVVEALLRKEDYRAAMALLMTWLGQVEQVPLEDGEHTFHGLAQRWMLGVCGPLSVAAGGDIEGPSQGPALTRSARLELVNKFFDYLEANSEDYWNAPRLDLPGTGSVAPNSEDHAKADGDLYEAAYEDITYRDSAEDEVEAEVLDFMPQKDFDLTAEAERLDKHVRFLATVASLWGIATRCTRLLVHSGAEAGAKSPPRFGEWLGQARANQQGLLALLDAIYDHEIPKPSGSYESLVEFDRRNTLKERLLGAIIATCLDTAVAIGALQGAAGLADARPKEQPAWEPWVLRLEQALWKGDVGETRALLPAFIKEFQQEPLLYTPLARGGNPRQVLQASIAQALLDGLADNLPRLGLVRETFQVVRTAFAMEQAQPAGGPRVTGFDRLFLSACQATVEAVLDAASRSGPPAHPPKESEGERIATLLERIIEPFLGLWIQHSKTMRVTTVEAISSDESFQPVRDFIQRYGRDLFHQRFLSLGNLRGILHRGVDGYLDYLLASPDPLHPIRLVEELDQKIPRPQAARFLEAIFQVLIENYEEYRDYNQTTAQSDFGDNLHQLLDFLRLKASYERNAWQLRPLHLVHEILTRRHGQAADFWRDQVEELTRDLADEHVRELQKLEKTHGMHLRTVADRLGERFVQPFEVDRLCALIGPAMDQARQFAEHTPLEKAIERFAAHPAGAGLDVPNWLRRLQGEVQRVRDARTDLARLAESIYPVPKIPVTLEDLRQQLQDWDQQASDEAN